MNKEEQLQGKKLPLELLTKAAETNIGKTSYLNHDEIIIGICVKDKAWLPVTFYPDFSDPKDFLSYAKEISGLPLYYPTEEDFNDLKENLTAVTETIAQIRAFKQHAHHQCSLRINDFRIENIKNSLAYSAGKKKNVPIRFVVDLTQLA